MPQILLDRIARLDQSVRALDITLCLNTLANSSSSIKRSWRTVSIWALINVMALAYLINSPATCLSQLVMALG